MRELDLHDLKSRYPDRHAADSGRFRGTASGSYTLPAGTSPGTYTIQAAYNGTPDFAGSSDSGHNLTVAAAATATAAANASTPFSEASQAVPLSATVTSPAGTVNEGTLTFTILMPARRSVRR